MRCEKLKAREREKLLLLREEENVECGGYQRAMRLHREVDQIFSYHPCISSLKIKKVFLHDMLYNRPSENPNMISHVPPHIHSNTRTYI